MDEATEAELRRRIVARLMDLVEAGEAPEAALAIVLQPILDATPEHMHAWLWALFQPLKGPLRDWANARLQ